MIGPLISYHHHYLSLLLFRHSFPPLAQSIDSLHLITVFLLQISDEQVPMEIVMLARCSKIEGTVVSSIDFIVVCSTNDLRKEDQKI